MRRIVLTLSLISFLACSPLSKEKKAIEKFIETDKKGNKYDLNIKFEKFELSDITIADSIQIFQEKYEEERDKKIASLNKMKELYEDRVKEYTHKSSFGSSYFLKKAKKNLEENLAEIEKTKNWKPDYLSKYDDRDKFELLNKKANAIVRFKNPRLSVEQTVHADFILNKEGTKCLKYIRIKD